MSINHQEDTDKEESILHNNMNQIDPNPITPNTMARDKTIELASPIKTSISAIK